MLSSAYAATTVGSFALCALVAFEATAVTTVMPSVARQLDGVSLYALAFAAPLASGVIGMVAAGAWSDRRGPARPLASALLLFCVGLLICGSAPTMEILLVGRVCQGLGGGAITVTLYVLVGLIYPASLRPSIFAWYAAAWVLPTLFGPAIAAYVAAWAGWRWVFLGSTVFVLLAAVLIISPLRRLQPPPPVSTPLARRLGWATLAAVAVLSSELLGSASGALALLAVVALVVAVRASAALMPPGTLRARTGLPAVIGTRAMLCAVFFCAEAYVVFLLEERWGLAATVAGLALTAVGLMWAVGSQVQARLGGRVSDPSMLVAGSVLVLLGSVGILVGIAVHLPALAIGVGYAVAGTGMGLAYPRTAVATLAASTDGDRGAHSSALSVAESLGAAASLAISGIVFETAPRLSLDRFIAVYGLAVTLGAIGVLVAVRTRPAR